MRMRGGVKRGQKHAAAGFRVRVLLESAQRGMRSLIKENARGRCVVLDVYRKYSGSKYCGTVQN